VVIKEQTGNYNPIPILISFLCFLKEQTGNDAPPLPTAPLTETRFILVNDSDGNHPRGEMEGLVPRYFKMDFPHYNGKDDPLSWLDRCKQFFTAQQTNRGAPQGLAGLFPFEQRHVPWVRGHGTPSRASIRSNALGELRHLRQIGSVNKY
jgi:hypothetical protein